MRNTRSKNLQSGRLLARREECDGIDSLETIRSADNPMCANLSSSGGELGTGNVTALSNPTLRTLDPRRNAGETARGVSVNGFHPPERTNLYSPPLSRAQ